MTNDANNKDHEHVIHYKVDDEPESTSESELTPVTIMANAGLDPKTNYLELLVPGHEPISYKDTRETKIEMKNGMHFITKPIGPMPVS
jgi:hypothetical protein